MRCSHTVVCICTDNNQTMFGRCGDDTPSVVMPTSCDPLPCFDTGVVSEWETVVATWWKGLELLEVSPTV